MQKEEAHAGSVERHYKNGATVRFLKGEPPKEPEPVPEKKGGAGPLLLALAVVVIGGGAGWYIKIYRPKHQKAAEPEEDYGEEDYEDDGPPWDEDENSEEDEE